MKNAKWKGKALANLVGNLCQTTVLVEGRRDEEALARLEIGAVACSSRKPSSIAGGVAAGKKVVLLFDFDAEGERKNEQFARALQEEHGLEVDRNARRAFKALFGVKTIEEAPWAHQRLIEEIEGGHYG
ncbi:hypothetical protein HY995_04805 [Candidatus Micrarchaeota archaeon]|nr:hypothetical protein [Candidatus Micrarchaeota archaeon]MBI5177375.1 hypothetical protein [Candidatus Micrarchaeota archaeon]